MPRPDIRDSHQENSAAGEPGQGKERSQLGKISLGYFDDWYSCYLFKTIKEIFPLSMKDYQKKRRMKKIGKLRRALRDCLREKDMEESKTMYVKKPVQYLRFGR